MRASPKRVIVGAWLLLFCAAVGASCTYDFEAFDPRLGTGTTTGAGTGQPGTCTPGETVPCYSGPEGTEGVGLCVGGQTTCNDEGTGFGSCDGEVVPQAEDCNTPFDDDCDGEVNEPDAACECTPGNTTECYEGTVSTAGVGKCHMGQQICQPSGTGYGECYAQMLPSHESCATDVDDDCQGTTNDHCAVWSKRFREDGDQYPWGLAVDDSGNVIIAGELRYDVDFGGGSIGSGSDADPFVAKFDPDGTHIWSKTFKAAADTDYQVAMGVAVDSAGDVYVAGVFTGSIDFPGATNLTSAGGDDLFVVKLDGSTGDPIWSLGFGGPDDQHAYGISVSPAGMVVIGGRFQTTLTFGTDVLTSVDSWDGFLARFNAAGAYVRSKQFGGLGEDAVSAIAIDAAGATYIGGEFDASATFGTNTLTTTGGIDAFVAKFDPAGTHQYSLAIGPVGEDAVVTALSVDGITNVVVGGIYTGSIDTPAASYDSAGGEDMWVLKLDPNGAELWSHSFGSTGHEQLNGLGVDGSGNVMITGTSTERIDFGDGVMLGAGDDDWVIANLNPSGAVQYARRFGDHADQDARQVAADSSGNWLLVGEAARDIDLGAGLLIGSYYEDVVLGKFPP